jgi:prephenate dehydrogenase
LLQGRVTVVTPAPRTRLEHVGRVEQFWSALGAQVVRMTPEAHDQAVAMTSHATHLVSAALAAATPESALPLVASGWLDTTRIAAGDPALWLQILLTNRAQVLKSLGRFDHVLAAFRRALERQDAARLSQLLDAGKKTRDSVGS